NIPTTAGVAAWPQSTVGCACACGVFCGVVRACVDEVAATTIIVGRMHTLPSRGCTVWLQPMPWPVNPLEGPNGQTISRRAGCGKSARPVRREGELNTISSPYPYQISLFGPVAVANLHGGTRHINMIV